MMPSERDAFVQVAQNCHRDVDHFCDAPARMMNPFLQIPGTSVPMDPFMQDFGLMMDSLLDNALRMPIFVEFVSFGPQEEEHAPPEPEDEAVAQAILQVAANTHPDDVKEVTDRLVKHGNNMLMQEGVTADKRRMARRLTEVSPQDLHEHRRAFLPFGCPQRNRCLQEVYDHHAVSPACGSAMARLEYVRTTQYAHRVEQLQEEGSTLFQLTVLYVFAVATMLVLYSRRRSDMKATRRLKLRVLKAIYSTPELKAAVEKELGESLGHVPPLGMRTLMRFGLHGQEFRQWIKVARMVRLTLISAMTVLFLVAPLYFLPACVGLSAWFFWCVVFGQKRVRMCACCCCGATTEDVKEGTLTEEQMCCGCCKGTGVCSAACADCCGGGGDDAPGTSEDSGCSCCDCCNGGTCCCDCCASCSAGSCCGNCSCCSASSKKKAASDRNIVIYEGIQVQIV
jgi:hypothetical protein